LEIQDRPQAPGLEQGLEPGLPGLLLLLSRRGRVVGEGAPQLHEDGNLPVHHVLRKGNVDRAFDTADFIIEREYRTPSQEHACLEPEVALAIPDENGGITIEAPSQNVFFDRFHICRTLALPRSKVRVIQSPTGAAFGSREDIYAQIHAALGALLTQRPVRIVWSREETQIATTKRHPAVMKYKAALAEDGRILGMKIDVLADSAVYLLPVAAVLALVGIRLNSMEKRRRVGTKKKGRPAAAFLLPPEKTSKFVKVSVVPCRFAAVFQNLQA